MILDLWWEAVENMGLWACGALCGGVAVWLVLLVRGTDSDE